MTARDDQLMKDWDDELEAVSREIDALCSRQVGRAAGRGASPVARKAAVVQAQIDVERRIARARHVMSREYLLLPREQTLLHWARMYVDRVAERLASGSKLATKRLWLDLVRARLAGPEARPGAGLEPDDIVQLAVRQKSLMKTERLLTESVAALKEKRQRLATRHVALGIALANRRAAGALFGRLGATPAEALDGPLMRALGRYFHELTRSRRAENEPAVERAAKKLDKKASRMLEDCAAIIAETTVGAPKAAPDRSRNELELAMLELESLEAETRAAVAKAHAREGAVAGLLVVQKPDGTAKTEALDKTALRSTATHEQHVRAPDSSDGR